MSDRYSSPERVKRVSAWTTQALGTTIATLTARGLEVPPDLVKECEDQQRHTLAVDQFEARMKFGSSVTGHAEDVIDFLIDQGWTPPPGKFLLNDPEETP